MYKNFRHLLNLNIAILLISTSGALGKHIDLPVPLIIGLRTIIASGCIYVFCKWRNLDLKIQKKDRVKLLLSGILMGLHWITYFYALKLSNIAIGMISIFTFPIITSFLEPLILKVKFQKIQLLFGFLVLSGICILVPDFDFKNDSSIALILGILSAILYSLRNILTKSFVDEYNGSSLMFYQLITIAIILSPFCITSTLAQISNQLPMLLILAIITTAIGHTLFVESLKKFSTTSVSIMSSTQPVYGIIIGILFLNEFPNSNAIVGGSLILLTVVFESFRAYKKAP